MRVDKTGRLSVNGGLLPLMAFVATLATAGEAFAEEPCGSRLDLARYEQKPVLPGRREDGSKELIFEWKSMAYKAKDGPSSIWMIENVVCNLGPKPLIIQWEKAKLENFNSNALDSGGVLRSESAATDIPPKDVEATLKYGFRAQEADASIYQRVVVPEGKVAGSDSTRTTLINEIELLQPINGRLTPIYHVVVYSEWVDGLSVIEIVRKTELSASLIIALELGYDTRAFAEENRMSAMPLTQFQGAEAIRDRPFANANYAVFDEKSKDKAVIKVSGSPAPSTGSMVIMRADGVPVLRAPFSYYGRSTQ